MRKRSIDIWKERGFELHPEDRTALSSLVNYLEKVDLEYEEDGFAYALHANDNDRIYELLDWSFDEWSYYDGAIVLVEGICANEMASEMANEIYEEAPGYEWIADLRPADGSIANQFVGFPWLKDIMVIDPIPMFNGIFSWMFDTKLPSLEGLTFTIQDLRMLEITEDNKKMLYNLFEEVLPKCPSLELTLWFEDEYNFVAVLNEMIERIPFNDFPPALLSFFSTITLTPTERQERYKMVIKDLRLFRSIAFLLSSSRIDIGGYSDEGTGGSRNLPSRDYPMWPLLLKRFSQCSPPVVDKKAMLSTLYHVLREGPVLLSRCVPGQLDGNPDQSIRKQKRIMPSSTEGQDNNNNNNLEASIE